MDGSSAGQLVSVTLIAGFMARNGEMSGHRVLLDQARYPCTQPTVSVAAGGVEYTNLERDASRAISMPELRLVRTGAINME